MVLGLIKIVALNWRVVKFKTLDTFYSFASIVNGQPKITKEEAIDISYEKNKLDISGIPSKYAEPIKNAELKYYTKHPAINVNSEKYVWVVDIKYYNPDYNPPEVWGGFQDIVDAQTGEILNHDVIEGRILAY